MAFMSDCCTDDGRRKKVSALRSFPHIMQLKKEEKVAAKNLKG